jgi:hypothetical protein
VYQGLRPRSYELRDDPIKTISHVAFAAAAAGWAWYDQRLVSVFFGAFFALACLARLAQRSRSLLATPRGITVRRFPLRPIHIPWSDIAEIAVFEIGIKIGLHKATVRPLWIRVAEHSPLYGRLKLPKRVASMLPSPAPPGIIVDTLDHDADEVVRELKKLRAEYMELGVLPQREPDVMSEAH